MGPATVPATPRERTVISARSSSRHSRAWHRTSVCSGSRSAGFDGIDGHAVFMELGDSQTKWIDELVLRVNPGLIAHLFGIEVVGETEHPMFGPRLPRMAGRVELVESQERRSSGHQRALHGLLRHRRNG